MLNYCGIFCVCFPRHPASNTKNCSCVLNTSMPNPSQSLVHMATVRIKSKAFECLERPGTCPNKNSTSIHWADPPSKTVASEANMDPPCKHSRSWNPGGHSFGGTSCMYVNYNRRTSFCIWFLAAWLANVWSSLQCRVLPFQSIWKVSNLFIITSLICICLTCWHMLTVFWDWKRCTKKTQHGNKKKREQMKNVECEKDDQMLAMSWIIRKERPWDVDFGGFA